MPIDHPEPGSSVGMLCPAVKTGGDTEQFRLPINLAESSIKVADLVGAEYQSPQEFIYLPVMVGYIPDTSTAPQRPRFGKDHHRRKCCSYRATVLVRCGGPHLELKKEGVVHGVTFMKKRGAASTTTWKRSKDTQPLYSHLSAVTLIVYRKEGFRSI